MICDSTDAFTRPVVGGAVATTPAINLWLVDDNRRLRQTLQDLFGRCPGINCTAAFHSPNAVLSALASRVGPDVILLDMNLGEHNGLDAIRAIKSLSRSTQVLMLTTFFDQAAAGRATRNGAAGFLLKSFPLERIIAAVRAARQNPTPHLKVGGKVQPAGDPVTDAVQDSPSGGVVIRTGDLNATPASQRPLGWVKQCLDVIRNFRKPGAVASGAGKN